MAIELTKIRLVGFKSFVDPTVVEFPTRRVGIVGPNGCGKSNIIDAIRWVMGESSAKYLRGESMADVIFNGSTARKPVGSASVELFFDNSDGSLGGPWAEYTTISIRREVGRDGQSSYFLNGTRCRRKDIADVLMGTGLGPRSYAVIEQGMISRVIEAKPLELRTYIEEAAGISKYKERRRETENRIKHTNENLERLCDIREELDRQLAHLTKQASAANRYKEYKESERLLKAKLTSRRWHTINEDSSAAREDYRDSTIELEKQTASLRSVETQIEVTGAAYQEALDRVNEVQEEFYEIGNQITEHESSLRFKREAKQGFERDLTEAQQTIDNVVKHQTDDAERYESLTQQQTQLNPEFDSAQIEATEAEVNLSEMQQSMDSWQVSWDDFQSESAKASESAEVEKTRIHHLEKQIATSQELIEKASKEKAGIDTTEITTALNANKTKLAALQTDRENAETQLNSIRTQLGERKTELEGKRHDQNAIATDIQKSEGRLASLETLQQDVLGTNNDDLESWLSDNQLNEHARLAQLISIDADWQPALETVLTGFLDAICLDRFDECKQMQQWPEQGVSLTTCTSASTAMLADKYGLPSIVGKLQSSDAVPHILSGIYCASSLTEALDKVDRLEGNDSIITADGIWVGQGWLKHMASKGQEQGVFEREREINHTKETLESLIREQEALTEQVNTLSFGVDELEIQKETQQTELNTIAQSLSDVQSEIRVQKERISQADYRLSQLATTLDEQNYLVHQHGKALAESRTKWQSSLEIVQRNADTRERLESRRDSLVDSLQSAREQMKAKTDLLSELKLTKQKVDTEVEALVQAQTRLSAQLQELAARKESLQTKIEESIEPIDALSAALEELLEVRVGIEHRLTQAKQTLTNKEAEKREVESTRNQTQKQVDKLKDHVQTLEVNLESMKVRLATLEEQATEGEFDITETIKLLTDEDAEDVLAQNYESVQTKIARLGAINLAASDEYAAQSERKVYLDEQDKDLREALTELERAIAKIDEETKSRFKETYDIVNANFKSIFPKVFGGGQASLVLTENDLLNTGVSLVARPPGKKNATIHLLSGGEKALTAISLVFAIFQLNPAPFCMLDEVDAPLDDANVGRFCALLDEMSQYVKFIYISHNKLTISRADTLMGVTMNEPGVSRLVAVDVAEAVELAEA